MIRIEINEINNRKKNNIKINKSKSYFFEIINKTDKFLARLTKKKKRENIQINMYK